MDYRKEIKELIQHLNLEAKKNRELAEKVQSSYIRGLDTGYANAYELCAEWLHEILES